MTGNLVKSWQETSFQPWLCRKGLTPPQVPRLLEHSVPFRTQLLPHGLQILQSKISREQQTRQKTDPPPLI